MADASKRCKRCGGPKRAGRGRKLCDACATAPAVPCVACGEPAVTRGRCNKHYRTALRSGAIERERWPIVVPAEQRFWPKVDKNGAVPTHRPDLGPCWVWTGEVSEGSRGYGRFALERAVPIQAHRYAYELLVGPIPDGLQIDHLCRNRACVNAAHLEAVTQAENLRRGKGWAGLNAQKTHCAYGHQYSPENTYVSPTTGYRVCRACARRRDRERRPRRRQDQ